jgi:transcriptional regulator with XRE-family HTH domain
MTKKPPPIQLITSWEDFAHAVRNWRQKKSKTQSEFAEEIGVSQPLIAQVEKGEPVSQRNLRRIAEKLAVETSALQDSDSPKSKSIFAYCASARCPNLRFAANEGELFIAPVFYAVKKLSFESCPMCDLPLHRQCPECSQSIPEKRLFCPFCKQRFVQIPASLTDLMDEELQDQCDRWDERNRRIRVHLGFE